jgi:hypothetical protein
MAKLGIDGNSKFGSDGWRSLGIDGTRNWNWTSPKSIGLIWRQISKVCLGSICTAIYSLAETPKPTARPPHLDSDTRALLVSQDRRHLFVTSCLRVINTVGDISKGLTNTLKLAKRIYKMKDSDIRKEKTKK